MGNEDMHSIGEQNSDNEITTKRIELVDELVTIESLKEIGGLKVGHVYNILTKQRSIKGNVVEICKDLISKREFITVDLEYYKSDSYRYVSGPYENIISFELQDEKPIDKVIEVNQLEDFFAGKIAMEIF